MGIGLYSEFPTVGIGATLVAGFTPSHPLQFGFPIVSANGSLHEPDPHPACGHPLPSDGRGAGGEGASYVQGFSARSFAWENSLPEQHAQR